MSCPLCLDGRGHRFTVYKGRTLFWPCWSSLRLADKFHPEAFRFEEITNEKEANEQS